MKSCLVVSAFFFSVFFVLANASRDLIGDKVYEVTPLTTKQVLFLQELVESSSVENGIDFWTTPSAIGNKVRIHVSSDQLKYFNNLMNVHDMKVALFDDNLARTVELERIRNSLAKNGALHTRFMKHAEINSFLDTAAQSCGSRCSLQSIGKSFEGRDMKIIKIGNNPNNPIVWIDGGIHAREWISPATVVYIIDKLVNTYSSDSGIRSLCDSYNFHILPVHNPDGYDYTHSSSKNRFWRKTRSTGRSCIGVDGNRNFGYHFGGQGTSSSSCSDIYRGPKAFSEVETAAVRDYVTSIKSNTRAFLTVHSYGQYVLIPFGYARNIYPSNYDDMLAAAKVAATEIRKQNKNRRYTVGHSANLLYPAAGASDDWARSIGIPYSYCFELPDTGYYGFDVPASFILPVGKETLAGVKAMLEYIKNK